MNLKGALVLLVLAAAGIVGWHLTFWGPVVERVEKIPSIQAVNRAVPVSVKLNPITNEVEIGLAIAFASEPNDLIAKLGSAVGVTVATEYWPQEVERDLGNFAWAERDLYAILVPYRAVVVDKGARKKD